MSRRSSLFPGLVLGLTVLCEAGAVALSWGRESSLDTGFYAVHAIALATAGALILRRHPWHRIGLLFLGLGLFNTVMSDLGQGWALFAAERGLPGVAAGEWLVTANWQLAGFAWILIFTLFPDGRIPGRAWRWVPRTGAIGLAVAWPAWTLGPAPDAEFASGRNPLTVEWLPAGPMLAIGMALFLGALVASAVSLVLRCRAAYGIERRQLKGFTSAAVLAAVGLPASFLLWGDGPLAPVLSAVVLTTLPVVACVAILRYRLYDVDVLVDRTVVYATVTALLAGAYALTALLVGTALGSGSPWATAGGTLVVAVAFRPLRDRVQDVADRRFHRARYRALARMESYLDDLRAGLAASEQVEPLLRELTGDPSLRLLVHPPDGDDPVGLDGLPAADSPGDGQSRLAVERDGRALAVVLHRDDDDGDDRALLPRLISTGGLAIEIARLEVELRRRLDEVRASRARVVAAAADERHRLERDLHDGAQQRLVGIGLALRHAQHELRAGRAATPTLDDAVDELTVAIDELRELARGLRPTRLDDGLGPAFRDLARRVPVPVAVTVSDDRFDQGVEGAAWFVGCEGLTNAVKHASASAVALRADRVQDRLVVTVSDDGIGGAEPGTGSGLRGLADRVAVLGGVLRVDSPPGGGTTVTAELPCGS